MKWFASSLAFLSFGLNSLLLLRFKSTANPGLTAIARPFKLAGAALAYLTLPAGALGALLGFVARAPLAIFMGGIGAGIAAGYIRRVKATGPRRAPDSSPRLSDRSSHGRNRADRSRLFQPASNPRWLRDLPFWTIPGNDRQLLCDLWRPAPAVEPSGLAFIYLHGGGWTSYDKDNSTRCFFRSLVDQGHLVMDVAYRLFPEVIMSEMVNDARRAVAWMKEKGPNFGVSPSRIVLAGNSAGGHLALLAAYTANRPGWGSPDLTGIDSSVAGVVAAYPPVDIRSHLVQRHNRGIKIGPYKLLDRREVLTGLLGGQPDEIPEVYRRMSPNQYVASGCPPTMLVQGEHDSVVPVAPVREMHQKLVAAGVPAVYVEYPANEHAFDLILPQISPSARAATGEVLRFLSFLPEG